MCHVFLMSSLVRPDMIDGAMLRPGRLDKLLYVHLPVASERFQILKTVSQSAEHAHTVGSNSLHCPKCVY